ncbi:MAG: hypothetical protein O2955_05480 [Planctomycetota bacterium]|nr:hypothetical protein [Planctomycetota bacterium]MDA1211943.1 hypothetical protein [Planctomycetota bacterium]
MPQEPNEFQSDIAPMPPAEVHLSSKDLQHAVNELPPKSRGISANLSSGLRWGFCILIVLLVVDRGIKLWQHDDLQDWDFQFRWFVLAGITNVVGWLPAVYVWRRMLQFGGASVPATMTARAYYAGHLGKYIPGKAAVLAVRAALLKPWGTNIWLSMMTTTLETLATMSLGLLIAFCLVMSGVVPGIHELWSGGGEGLADPATIAASSVSHIGVALLILLGFVPTICWGCSGVMIRLLHVVRPSWNQTGRSWQIPWSSWLLLAIGWGIHGISLGLTMKGVTGESILWHDWPMWTASVSWATAGAFFVFLVPGGLGVREGLLIEFLRLQPGISPRIAVATAVMLRLVWLAAEFTAASTLYIWFYRRTHLTERNDP